jgi:Fe-S-cluster-containing dehydrogenase component
MKQFAVVIDIDRCIGCRGGCQAACKHEHDIALGPSYSKMYDIGPTGTYPDLEFYFLPVTCQQCENPDCIVVCPTGACRKSKDDGVVYIDREICIGCKTCKDACPYNAIIFNNELHVCGKCDICASLRNAGEKPVCVKNCSGAAIKFGDINDSQSEVAKLLAEAGERSYALSESETKPSGRFILRRAAWQDPLPYMNKEGGKSSE